MEEIYWKQFWETGKVTDYLTYRNCFGKNISRQNTSGSMVNLESEDAIESDYSDRDGFTGISYR